MSGLPSTPPLAYPRVPHGFGLVALWHLGLIQLMLDTDRAHVSSLIPSLFALTIVHCLVQILFVPRELTAVRIFEDALRRDPDLVTRITADPSRVPQSMIFRTCSPVDL
jgi:hypothetical protein